MSGPLSRAERRRLDRHSNKFMARTHFTKREVEDMNSVAYNMGVEHTLETLKDLFGFGEKRKERIVNALLSLQERDFVQALKNK